MARPKPHTSISQLMDLVERQENLRLRLRDRRTALLVELATVDRQLAELGEKYSVPNQEGQHRGTCSVMIAA